MRYLLLLLSCSLASANPAPHRLDAKPLPILSGRFSIQLPLGMQLAPNPVDSIGLTLPRTFAARAVLDEEKGKFVLTVTDTLTFVDGNFEQGVKQELAASGVAFTWLRKIEQRGMSIVLVEPILPRSATDSNLVFVAYVKTPDKQVVAFAFFVFGEALRTYVESWARVARETVETLNDSGNPPPLEITGAMIAGEATLAITVPNRWYVIGLYAAKLRTEGLWLREKVALGQPARACMVDRSLSTAPPGATRTPSRWLGKPAVWRIWQSNSDHQAEIEVKFGDHRVRGWCTSRTAAGLREAQRIVGEMTVQ